MVLSMVMLVKPSAQADSLVSGKDLYTRVADVSTMDSYLDASLGGYVSVDGVSMPSVRNNDGSRYAGEVWADKSVYARYDTVPGNGDGAFDGQTLQLGKYTDGVDAQITMDPDADFLHVFSALGSSEVLSDTVPVPLDVVFVLDTSSTMVYNSGDYYRLTKAADALNEAIKAVMKANDENRVALVTYDQNAEIYLPLDHYTPITDRKNYFENENNKYPDCYSREDYKDAYIIFDSRINASTETYNPNNTELNRKFNFWNSDFAKENGGSYSPENRVKHLADDKSYYHYTFDFIQLNAQSTTTGKKHTDWINAHSGTNTHQGLYTGLDILRKAKDKTLVVETGTSGGNAHSGGDPDVRRRAELCHHQRFYR